MLRKQEASQLPNLLANIRLRREQSLLIFLSCRTTDMEQHLVGILKKEFSGQFPIKEIDVIRVAGTSYKPRSSLIQPTIISI
ncbi:MAG: hypothetical protein GY940_38735 [bacterium]|nr:hypothetical protein [bacterium]